MANGFDWGDWDIGEVFTTGLDLYRSLQEDSPGAGGPDVVINAPTTVWGGETMPVMGSAGQAIAAGGIWLSSLLARSLGRGAAGAVFTAANGVRVRLVQLWPLVRRYGWQAVAGALGITAGALGTLLAEASQHRPRRRRRGISYADISRTRRTIKTLRKMTRLAGIGGGGRARGGYRPRRRPRAYYC